MVCNSLAIPLTGVGFVISFPVVSFVFSFPGILDSRNAVVCVLLAIPLTDVGFVVSFPGIARKRNGLKDPKNEFNH